MTTHASSAMTTQTSCERRIDSGRPALRRWRPCALFVAAPGPLQRVCLGSGMLISGVEAAALRESMP